MIGDKKQMVISLVEEASLDEVMITDDTSIPKKKSKRRLVHHSRTLMDVSFLRRSAHETLTVYCCANPTRTTSIQEQGPKEAELETLEVESAG